MRYLYLFSIIGTVFYSTLGVAMIYIEHTDPRPGVNLRIIGILFLIAAVRFIVDVWILCSSNQKEKKPA